MLNISEPVTGKFRKVRVDPIKRVGQYRGKGSLQLTPEGLKISGRHVLSLGARWGIGLGLFFGSVMLSMAITEGNGYCAPGFIPIYFLVEYFLLKREEILVPYSEITAIGGDAKHTLVGVEFEGESNCSPVVLNTPHWKALLHDLKLKTSLQGDVQAQVEGFPETGANATAGAIEGEPAHVLESVDDNIEAPIKMSIPWSKSKVLIRSVFAGIGWYFVFYMLCSLILIGIFSATGTNGVRDIDSLVLRIFVIALLFLSAAIPTYYLTRRYYRKKIKLMADV